LRWVRRDFCASWSWHFRAGADARVAARGQAGGSGHEPARPAGEDATIEVAAKLTLHMFRHRPVVVVTVAALGEPGLEVLLDAAIAHALARTARPIPRRCARSGPEVDLHTCLPLPRVAALGLRVGGTVWRALLATRTKSRG